MSTPNEAFFFVRHPSYHSFALIQVRGEVPEEIPEEVLHLIPGNESGIHDKAIVLEKDERYLKSVMHGCADWFSELEQKAWIQVADLTYRQVGRCMML